MKRVIPRITIVAMTLLLALPGTVSAAPAAYDCQGLQTQYAWYGVSGKTYTYWGWDAWHVSSFYVHSPGFAEFNYIESGILALPDEYPQAFIAYENFPDTGMYSDHRGQVRVNGNLRQLGSWVYCEINNHQLGGSNWYASAGGQTLLHGLTLWRADYIYPYERVPATQGNLRSAAERWYQVGWGYENWMSSYLHKMKDSRGNWYDWTSLATYDNDPKWNPVKVHNAYWHTTKDY